MVRPIQGSYCISIFRTIVDTTKGCTALLAISVNTIVLTLLLCGAQPAEAAPEPLLGPEALAGFHEMGDPTPKGIEGTHQGDMFLCPRG